MEYKKYLVLDTDTGDMLSHDTIEEAQKDYEACLHELGLNVGTEVYMFEVIQSGKVQEHDEDA